MKKRQTYNILCLIDSILKLLNLLNFQLKPNNLEEA